MTEKYFGFCPCCEKETQQEHVIDEPTTFDIGGVTVTVPDEYYQCLACGDNYWTGACKDALELAYAEYEKITGKKWKGIYK